MPPSDGSICMARPRSSRYLYSHPRTKLLLQSRGLWKLCDAPVVLTLSGEKIVHTQTTEAVLTSSTPLSDIYATVDGSAPCAIDRHKLAGGKVSLRPGMNNVRAITARAGFVPSATMHVNVFVASMWRVVSSNAAGIALRTEPRFSASRTGEILSPNALFAAAEVVEVDTLSDVGTYIRPEGATGFCFVRHPEKATRCLQRIPPPGPGYRGEAGLFSPAAALETPAPAGAHGIFLELRAKHTVEITSFHIAPGNTVKKEIP